MEVKKLGLLYSPRIIKQIYEQPEALEQTIASEGTVTAVSAQPLIIKSEEKTAKIRYFFIIILIGFNWIWTQDRLDVKIVNHATTIGWFI